MHKLILKSEISVTKLTFSVLLYKYFIVILRDDRFNFNNLIKMIATENQFIFHQNYTLNLLYSVLT